MTIFVYIYTSKCSCTCRTRYEHTIVSQIHFSSPLATCIFQQELKTFKKFGESLLNRSNKVTDLTNAIHEYDESVQEGSSDQVRMTK